MADPTATGDEEAAAPAAGAVVGEARWPMAGAVVAAVVLTAVFPRDLRTVPLWVLALVEGGLLAALVAADPGRIDRRSQALRAVSVVLVALLVLHTLGATGKLVVTLVRGGALTNSADTLLLAGVSVWVCNNIAFALLYWALDGGGAASRAHRLPRYPDLAFPQQLSPELAPPGWRPAFVDYLYLGFTNATAFSPTDVMPLVPWAKVVMAVQSTTSLALVVLVVARAVNVLQ